jgi:cyclic lactone autoinducer peptide
MKKLTLLMATVGATVLTLIATAISVGACNWGCHQPQEPDMLG